ncbi:capsular associated protein [Borealophlyctis nickersoniae]|nr:capsular associated protein [Borealophlyctis nickersoniae]
MNTSDQNESEDAICVGSDCIDQKLWSASDTGDSLDKAEGRAKYDIRDFRAATKRVWRDLLRQLNCGAGGQKNEDVAVKFDSLKSVFVNLAETDNHLLDRLIDLTPVDAQINRGTLVRSLLRLREQLIGKIVSIALEAPQVTNYRRCAGRQRAPCDGAPSRYAPLFGRRIYLAMNVHNNEAVLPEVMAQVVRLAGMLGGPDHIFVSVYENGSRDRTRSLLRQWEAALAALGIEHSIVGEVAMASRQENRILKLARVRNTALAPLLQGGGRIMGKDGRMTPPFDRIAFMNDVYWCAEDVMEMLHQSLKQDADITCGLDYNWADGAKERGEDPVFYDIWIARNMDGVMWTNGPWNNFTQNHLSDNRLNRNLPFQAQCCWNGGAILRIEPFIRNGVRFRAGNHQGGECAASECSLLCNDFLYHGWDRVLVVPSVRYSYDVDGDVALLKILPEAPLAEVDEKEEKVNWQPAPPTVECIGLVGLGNAPDQPWVHQPLVQGKRPEH